MKKLDLPKKVANAGKRAGFDNGWDVFTDMIYKSSQEKIANKFAVSYRTSQRWHNDFKKSRN